MQKINKKTIGGIVLAAVLVAGMLTLMPSASADLTALDKIGTIINILLNIQEDLSDKLKLIVGKDNTSTGFSGDEGTFLITINATNASGELTNFNLKEVYVCGEITEASFGSIVINEVQVEEGDIVIADPFGGEAIESATFLFDPPASDVDTASCADILTILSQATPRAGEAGLGSDTDIVIKLGAIIEEGNAAITRVKCIAFVPQEAEILTCDAELEVPM